MFKIKKQKPYLRSVSTNLFRLSYLDEVQSFNVFEYSFHQRDNSQKSRDRDTALSLQEVVNSLI